MMPTSPTQQVEVTLTLREDERAESLRLLEQTLADTRVEVHRTHTPNFCDQVLQQEELLRGLIHKLQRAHP